MTERNIITLYLAVNESGESGVSWDSAGDAIDELRDNDGFEAVRIVTINVTLDLPTVETINVAVAVPAPSQAPAEVTVS